MSSTETRAAAVVAPSATALTAAAAGLRAGLHRVSSSLTIGLISDSTGTDTDEWFGILGHRLQERHRGFSLVWEPWNTTTQDFDVPTVLVQGTAGGGGRRGARLTSGALRRPHATPTPGDQEVTVAWAPSAAGWRPGGAAGPRTLVSRWTTTGAGRVWRLEVMATGQLRWSWSVDGTSEASVVSTAAVPFTGTTAGWVRVSHDVDNGAGGHTVTFHTSGDGVAWTRLGTPVVTPTAIALSSAATDYLVGAWASAGVPTGFADGTVHRVEIRPGALVTTPGTRPGLAAPPLPEDWDQATTAASVELVGAPLLTLRCAAASGQAIAYFDDPVRRSKIAAPAGQCLVLLSTGHNEGNVTGVLWARRYADWLANLRARLPYTPLVAVTQNPATAAVTGGARQAQIRAARGITLASLAAVVPGAYVLDTYEAFTDLATQVEADGTHPTQGNAARTSGSDVWADWVLAHLDP